MIKRVALVNGCADEAAFNYEEASNTDDESCIAVVNGCTNQTADNYNADANTEDGSCECAPLSFSNNNTGSNMTLFIDSDVALATAGIEEGDKIGVFFTNAAGEELSAGYIEWTFGQMQISAAGTEFESTGASSSVSLENGFATGESIIWKAQTALGILNITASYVEGEGTFASDGFLEVSGFETSVLCTGYISGCMDPHYLEYNSEATLNTQESCVTEVVLGLQIL